MKTGWCLVGGGICFLFGLVLLVRLQPKELALHDFAQEWVSAKNFLTGRPVYLDLRQSTPLYFGGAYYGDVQVNAHPPVSVLLAVPFAMLDYRQAFIAWNLVSLACLAVSIWLVLRPAGLNYPAWMLLPIAAFLLSGNSLAQQVNQGQLNLLLLLLLTLAWSADRAGRPGWAGVWVGVAMAIKLFPGFLLVYFVCRRRWVGAASLVVTFLIGNALGVGLLGVATYRAYWLEVLPRVGEFRYGWPNASVTGYWYKLFGVPRATLLPLWQAPAVAAIATAISSLAISLAAAWKCWKSRTFAEADLAFGTCIVAMVLVSPITWDHYFLMLLLPFAILWKQLPPTGSGRWLLIAAIVVLTIVYPKWVWDVTIPGPGELVREANVTPSQATGMHTLTVISYQFYTLLALFAFCLLLRPSVQPSPASVSPETAY